MDYRNALLSAYYDNLKDAIIVNGSVIEIGTKISNEATEFIRYFISSDVDNGTAEDTIRDVGVNIDCVGIQPKNMADDSVVDSMVEQVKQILENITLKGWVMELTLDDGTEESSGESDVNYIVRRTITFKHFIRKE